MLLSGAVPRAVAVRSPLLKEVVKKASNGSSLICRAGHLLKVFLYQKLQNVLEFFFILDHPLDAHDVLVNLVTALRILDPLQLLGVSGVGVGPAHQADR